MAEKQNQTDSSGKNGSPKTCPISSCMEKGFCGGKDQGNTLSKPNRDKSKNTTKEERIYVNEKTKEAKNGPAKETKHDQSVDELACKEGYLSVHGKAFRKRPKQCWFRLLPSSPSSRAHLQQYSKAENAKQKPYMPEHVILANDVNSVACLQEPEHAFVIRYRDESLILSAEDDLSRTNWIKMIQKVLLSENQDTFTNVRIPRSFDVHISKATQIRIGDGNLAELLVEYGSIAIIASNNIRLVRWPIARLRSFGFDADTFMVTAGRYSEHGEGVYSFITKQGEEIHRTVKAAKTKDSSFDGHPPGMGWQLSIPEGSSPPRPYHGLTKHTPFQGGYVGLPSDETINGFVYKDFSLNEGGYACFQSNDSHYEPVGESNDSIYEPVGAMLQIPNMQKFPASQTQKTIKARHPTDPGSSSRPSVQQGSIRSSVLDTPSQKSNVQAARTESDGRKDVCHNISTQWSTHANKNVVTGETAFPIHPNEKVIPREKQPSADESLYATVDCSKKTNQKKDSVIALVPEHKRVYLPRDANGYTLVSIDKP